MFVEIIQDIVRLSEPVIDLPKFIKKKPLDLITAIICIYGLSKDTDRYITILESEDGTRLYIAYKGLYEDAKTLYENDIIIYKGKPCMLSIVDYDNFSSNDADPKTVMNLIYIMCVDALTFLKANYIHMMYRKTKTLEKVFNEATLPMFIQTVLLSYSMSDKLKETIVEVVQSLKTKEDDKFTMEELDFYISILDKHGINLLLENSAIAVGNCKLVEDSGNEDETI